MLSSCIQTGTPVLTNLSFGKSDSTFTPPIVPAWTCNSMVQLTSLYEITWYYYDNYAAQADGCQHNTTTSTISITGTWTNVLSKQLRICNQGCEIMFKTISNLILANLVFDGTGTVTAGSWNGQTATVALVVVNTAGILSNQCNSVMGMEARSGTFLLQLGISLTCNGIFEYEFCPGVH